MEMFLDCSSRKWIMVNHWLIWWWNEHYMNLQHLKNAHPGYFCNQVNINHQIVYFDVHSNKVTLWESKSEWLIWWPNQVIPCTEYSVARHFNIQSDSEKESGNCKLHNLAEQHYKLYGSIMQSSEYIAHLYLIIPWLTHICFKAFEVSDTYLFQGLWGSQQTCAINESS